MLDLHGNLTEEFANKVDTWAGYRTAPHRDIDETLRRALSLLVRSLRSGKRPKPAFVRVPLLLQGEKATTDAQPMKGLLAMARRDRGAAGDPERGSAGRLWLGRFPTCRRQRGRGGRG